VKRKVLEIIPKPFRRTRHWFSRKTLGEVAITLLGSAESEHIRFSDPFGLQVIKDRMRKGLDSDIDCFLFDFGHITVLNAIFISTMVHWKKLAEERGARIAFFGMNDEVRMKFEKTQASDFLTIFESKKAALEFLEG
jgi:anti-anti-sigma regulatory factor